MITLQPDRAETVKSFVSYVHRLHDVLTEADWTGVAELAEELLECLSTGRQVFLCGNGGSAGNAVHIANDFLYGVTRIAGRGINANALSANVAVLTCLANDEGYEHVFAHQLAVQGRPRDVLIALSGSGNSPNILNALDAARELGLRTYAILGYAGGLAKHKADVAIHFAVDDMQISEDLQLITAHMIMQWLYHRRERP